MPEISFKSLASGGGTKRIADRPHQIAAICPIMARRRAETSSGMAEEFILRHNATVCLSVARHT